MTSAPDDLTPAELAQLEDSALREGLGAAGCIAGRDGTAVLEGLVRRSLMDVRGLEDGRKLFALTPAGLARVAGSGTFRAAKGGG